MKNIRLCTIILLSALSGGCVSLVEISGRALDGSAFAEKTIAVYRTEKKSGKSAGIELQEIRNKAGDISLIIKLDQFPAIKLCGSVPGENGEFHLTSLDYLGGNTNGWNEYRMEIYGSGNMTVGVTSLSFSLNPEIETLQISSGKIRRFDTRITGADALASLNNRHERIVALVEWMNAYNTNVENISGEADRKAFENYWEPVLFPELVSRSKRPADWQREGDQWIRAEDIRWNTSYTDRVFPELLREIRNSGTMLRDWEEAFEWLFVEYEWERIKGKLSQETVLNKVKR